MTARCLMICLDAAASRLPDTDLVHLAQGQALAALEAVLWPQREYVLFATSSQPLPASHATRALDRLGDGTRLAVGLNGCIYPELFDGRARSIWRPSPESVPPAGLRVNELALHGMAMARPPADLLRRIAQLFDTAAPAELAHLSSLVALELHRAGWTSLLLPGGRPALRATADIPPRIVRAVLEFGGLRRLG